MKDGGWKTKFGFAKSPGTGLEKFELVTFRAQTDTVLAEHLANGQRNATLMDGRNSRNAWQKWRSNTSIVHEQLYAVGWCMPLPMLVCC